MKGMINMCMDTVRVYGTAVLCVGDEVCLCNSSRGHSLGPNVKIFNIISEVSRQYVRSSE